MRGLALAWFAAATLGVHAAGGPASADALVKFTSAGRGEPVQGYLTRPKGAGPFPAVVLLHTCLGLPAGRAEIGARIASWGYVALFVDDFGARGLKETCAVDFNEAAADAEGALAYLAGLSVRRSSEDRRGRLFARGRYCAQDRRFGRGGRVQGGGGLLSPMRQ